MKSPRSSNAYSSPKRYNVGAIDLPAVGRRHLLWPEPMTRGGFALANALNKVPYRRPRTGTHCSRRRNGTRRVSPQWDEAGDGGLISTVLRPTSCVQLAKPLNYVRLSKSGGEFWINQRDKSRRSACSICLVGQARRYRSGLHSFYLPQRPID